MYCKYCGNEIDIDSNYCMSCGKNLLINSSNTSPEDESFITNDIENKAGQDNIIGQGNIDDLVPTLALNEHNSIKLKEEGFFFKGISRYEKFLLVLIGVLISLSVAVIVFVWNYSEVAISLINRN